MKLTFSLLISSLTATGLALADPAGIGNFHKVNDQVYRGAQPTAEGFQNLLDVLASTNEVNIRPVSFYARPSVWKK